MTMGCCQLLSEFYDLISSEGLFLSPHVRMRTPQIGVDLSGLYAKLAKLCFDREERRWKLSQKFHLWEHLAEDQVPEWGNPRYWWVYGDEDLVREMISVADSVHPQTLAISCLTKFLWCIFDELLVGDVDADSD